MNQATEIYSREFDGIFFKLPGNVRTRIVAGIRELGHRLESFPHTRLQGRPEFRLRIGDYRVIYFSISSETNCFFQHSATDGTYIVSKRSV